jgi:hypothetical protein
MLGQSQNGPEDLMGHHGQVGQTGLFKSSGLGRSGGLARKNQENEKWLSGGLSRLPDRN